MKRFGRLVLLCVVTLAARRAAAATYTVDRNDDTPAATGCAAATPNDCSLRGAIIKANNHPGPDTIVLKAGTYSLTAVGAGEDAALTGDLDIRDDLTIQGDGQATTIIDAAGLKDATHPGDRAIHIDPAGTGALTVKISGVTIRNANLPLSATAISAGGGILNGGGTPTGSVVGSAVMLSDVAVRDNTAPRTGGGIANFGALSLDGCLIDHNKASDNGGGLFQGDLGSLDVTDTTVSNNFTTSGGGGGGGLYSGIASVDPLVPTVTILRSTFHDNAASSGAGILQKRGKVFVVNSTISHNQAGASGGGISSNGGVALFSSTIAINTSGGTAGGVAGDVSARNTILSGNSAKSVDSDCVGTLTSEGYDLVKETSGCTITGDTTGDHFGQDARLSALAANGGPTRTHALVSTSPAIDAGDPAGCTDQDGNPLAGDQRGQPRALDGDANGTARCDIGAYESVACTGKPAKPSPMTPGADETMSAAEVDLGWTDVACARHYKLKVRRITGQVATVVNETHLQSTGLTTPPLSDYNTFSWRVRACNAAGCSHATQRHFKTAWAVRYI